MALVTAPAEAMPVAGDDINAENVTNWLTNFRTFLDEAGNFDEANADLTGTDGLVGKSTAQTIAGLKSYENTGAAAAGIMSALEVGVNPASGTVTAGDGPRIVFYGDDSGGNKTTLGELRVPWVTVTDGATEAANAELLSRIAGVVTEVVSVGTDGFILNETGVDLDYRFETDTNGNAFTINSGLFGGVGGIGLGAAATAVGVVLIDPPALTADANTNIARLNIENAAAITVPAGTTSIAASLFLGEPNLTATGTITSAVTLYIEAAPTEGGTNNYALWVDSGVSAFGGNAVPDANDASALGTTTLGWADLHLAAGGVINWANGEITITETDANTLTIAGVATRLDLAAGILEMNNAVEWDTGVAVVAGEYSVGRDADGTNQLHFNTPTGATFEWSVNDVATATLSNTTLTLGSAVTGVVVPDNMFIGLGSGAGRIEFDDQATDEVNFLNCRLGIGMSTPANLMDIEASADAQMIQIGNTHATLAANMTYWYSARAGNSAYSFILLASNNQADNEFRFRGDGEALADGSFTGSGADYQEYIESVNGTALELGRSVVIEGERVRLYDLLKLDTLEDIIGVVRPKEWNKNSAVRGNAAWNHWTNKYLTDDWGRYVLTKGEKTLNPKYAGPTGKPDPAYLPRHDRVEWNLVGMLGQVQIKAGEPTNPRWRKMRNISPGIELWFIR